MKQQQWKEAGELRILIESSGGELKTHLATPCPPAGWPYTTVLQMYVVQIQIQMQMQMQIQIQIQEEHGAEYEQMKFLCSVGN